MRKEKDQTAPTQAPDATDRKADPLKVWNQSRTPNREGDPFEAVDPFYTNTIRNCIALSLLYRSFFCRFYRRYDFHHHPQCHFLRR